jgi:hypothetical protein
MAKHEETGKSDKPKSFWSRIDWNFWLIVGGCVLGLLVLAPGILKGLGVLVILLILISTIFG